MKQDSSSATKRRRTDFFCKFSRNLALLGGGLRIEGENKISKERFWGAKINENGDVIVK